MKILFLLWGVFAVFLYANGIYYDESNKFLNAKQSKEFLRTYFYKPLQTMQQSIVSLEVMSVNRIEGVQEICDMFKMRYDKEKDACLDDLGVKFCELKSAKEMKDYMLKFIEIPINLHNSSYMFMENNICGYVGKVKAFGYIWDFESRGGGMELTRDIDEKIFSIDENPARAYKQGKIEGNKAKKYLICIESHCNPRAEKENHEK